MICAICKETGILNQANNQEFYYCRTCKVEIELVDPPSDPYFEQDSSGEMEFPASFYESMWAMHKAYMQAVHRVDYTDHGIQDALDSITKAIAKKPELPGAFQEDPPVDVVLGSDYVTYPLGRTPLWTPNYAVWKKKEKKSDES